VAGSVGIIPERMGPSRWALAGVLAPPDENALRAADRVRLRAEMDFSGLGGASWMKPENVLVRLKQRGIPDPAGALERLDLAACHAAWREGLSHLVVLRLDPRPEGRWKLQCRVIDAAKRVAAATFSVEGPDPSALVRELRRETLEWMKKNR
jgi:hypothetical protein